MVFNATFNNISTISWQFIYFQHILFAKCAKRIRHKLDKYSPMYTTASVM